MTLNVEVLYVQHFSHEYEKYHPSSSWPDFFFVWYTTIFSAHQDLDTWYILT